MVETTTTHDQRPPPPALTPSYLRLAVPPRVVRSFENLVALANDQERLRDARKMVWRDKEEPAVELKTLRECRRHALRGGLRAASLAFGIRSGFNILVLAFRILRLPRKFRLSLIRHAIFGEDSFRFAAMIGSFVALYKYTLNGLPLITSPTPITPYASPAPHAVIFNYDGDDLEEGITLRIPATSPTTRRRSFQAQAEAHLDWVRKRTKRWHAVFAGAVAGGMGVMFEKKRRRVDIAQQLFVRGLQGSYNELSAKYNITIPFGPVIVFSLCCGQILYAFLLRPDTIPPGYVSWLQVASKLMPGTVAVNRDLVRHGKFNIADLESIINSKETHPDVRPLLIAQLERARDLHDYGPRYPSCAIAHPYFPSCTSIPIDRFFSVSKWALPIYATLNFIPMILFKRKQLLEEPRRMLRRAAIGTGRSTSFLGVFVLTYQSYYCIKNNLYGYLTSPSAPLKLPRRFVDILISEGSVWLGGFLCGLSLFVEAKHRRPELAMYVIPKTLESLWRVAKGKGFAMGPAKYGEAILCAVGMGMLMDIYQNNPHHLSGVVRRILYQFIGPN